MWMIVILLHFVYSCFDIVSLMVLFCVAIRRYSVFLLGLLFEAMPKISQVRFRLFVIEMSILLSFFPLLFSGYFCPVDDCVFCIVFCRCNQSSSALFSPIFRSIYECITGILNAGKSFSYIFSTFYSSFVNFFFSEV